MSSFTRAQVHPRAPAWAGGPRQYVVRGEVGDGFWFYFGRPEDRRGIHIPEGFVTDGASIPRWIMRVLPRRIRRWVAERLFKSAILHDRLRELLEFSLIEADAYFLVALEADGLRWHGQAKSIFHRAGRVLLREAAFIAVRNNRSRINHQPPA